MSETIAVLFIFFVLLLFGIIIYARFQKTSLLEKQEQLLGTKAIEIATRVLFLPELACTKGESDAEDNCFDMAKVRSIEGSGDRTFFEENEDYYFDLFSYSTISIEQIYPPPLQEGEITLYNKFDPARQNSEATFFIISLKDEINNYNGFGFLKVVIYS